LVAVGVLAMISTLVYGAFDQMSRIRKGVESTSERFHQGSSAMARMTRELQSAFLSLHRPLLNPGLEVSRTAFVGVDGGSRDRVDFTSFSHRRLGVGERTSDQNELSYFLSQNPDAPSVDLARREATSIDLEPRKGGVVQVLAEDVVSLDLRYFDPLVGDWVDAWDSTQPTGQFERLPAQIRIELVLAAPGNAAPYRFVTKVPLAMQAPLTFGLPR
jgi:general secretion pathway protein J